jgi:hypothetical protein
MVGNIFCLLSTVELHFLGLIWTESHQDMQKIRIIGYVGSLKFGCYYLQYVPATKPFEHAGDNVLEVITLHCT